jgi:hypothetical protein
MPYERRMRRLCRLPVGRNVYCRVSSADASCPPWVCSVACAVFSPVLDRVTLLAAQ